jgi:hypothetical protein
MYFFTTAILASFTKNLDAEIAHSHFAAQLAVSKQFISVVFQLNRTAVRTYRPDRYPLDGGQAKGNSRNRS